MVKVKSDLKASPGDRAEIENVNYATCAIFIFSSVTRGCFSVLSFVKKLSLSFLIHHLLKILASCIAGILN